MRRSRFSDEQIVAVLKETVRGLDPGTSAGRPAARAGFLARVFGSA